MTTIQYKACWPTVRPAGTERKSLRLFAADRPERSAAEVRRRAGRQSTRRAPAASPECHSVDVVQCASYHQSQQRVGPNISDLDPDLQKQWDHKANLHLGNVVITHGSDKKVWWTCGQCPDGHLHMWLAAVKGRSRGSGCPQCSGRQVCQHNSLATRFPKIAASWDHDRNDFSADMVVAKSHKRVHWRCPVCQHAWTARIVTRVSHDSGCPECAKHTRIKPKRHPTFAESQHPLLDEWDHERNVADGLFPDKVSLRSNKKVHWVCSKCAAGQRHSWVAQPRSRLSRKTPLGCPYCTSRRACKCNSLQTHYPSIAAEWDYDLNDGTPEDYTHASTKYFWWRNPTRGACADLASTANMKGNQKQVSIVIPATIHREQPKEAYLQDQGYSDAAAAAASA